MMNYKLDTPAKEFQLSIIDIDGNYTVNGNNVPEIILCRQGSVKIADTKVKQGESVLITECNKYTISGKGHLSRATVQTVKRF